MAAIAGGAAGERKETARSAVFSQFKLSDLWPAMVNVFQWQGVQYALPKDNGSSIIYYNTDAFRSAGVPAPAADWTWGTCLSAAQRLTVTNMQQLLNPHLQAK